MTDKKILPLGRARYTPERASRVVSLLRDGASIGEATDRAGVAASTFKYWRRRYPEVDEAVREAIGEADRKAIRRREPTAVRAGLPRTAEAEEAVLGRVREGLSRTAAAALSGVPVSALQRWLEDERFETRVLAAEGEFEVDILARLRTATDSQWTKWMTLLERRRPDQYSRRFEVPHKERVQIAAKTGAMLGEAIASVLAEVGLSVEQQELVRRKLAETVERAV